MPEINYKNPASRRVYEGYINDINTLPVSFKYNGEAFSGFDRDIFTLISESHSEKGERDENVFVLKDADGLTVTVRTAYYENYGAYEWTVTFYNGGSENSGIISDFTAADICFYGEDPILRGILGDHENLYKPYESKLSEGNVNHKSVTGKPTHKYFPYYNLEYGGGGVMTAIGWGGTWEAEFAAINGGARFTASGTNGLCTYLKPGESIRSPLMLFIPYAVRDESYAVNLWRSWYVNCNMPHLNAQGDILKPFSTTFIAGDTGLPNSDGSISERHFTWRPSLEKMLDENIKPDYRWFDAGWYFDPYGKTVESDWWGTVGGWEFDTEKWPGESFRESTDFAREHGMKTFIWFEPERVTHVDGLIKNYGYKAEWSLPGSKEVTANNIGDADCLKWTAGRIISVMEKQGADMYREDNNYYPAECWAAADEKEGPGDRKSVV